MRGLRSVGEREERKEQGRCWEREERWGLGIGGEMGTGNRGRGGEVEERWGLGRYWRNNCGGLGTRGGGTGEVAEGQGRGGGRGRQGNECRV
ncbi:hypothetical protein Pmani_023903 [Petrolisthes manimaculis]|uniref:Uncharacterized protein n=1 Tax=Petrolisthes manimaculis TaxID=1843537 RepID=A0AAE1P988_9EUCA|nr:hypothetical protein Pmani_023903 [Petrolisthes manimaculis]